MVSLFAFLRKRFAASSKNSGGRARKKHWRGLAAICAALNDEAAAEAEEEENCEQLRAGAEVAEIAREEANKCGGASRCCERSSTTTSNSDAATTRDGEGAEEYPWRTILQKLTAEAKGKFEDGLESEKFITVGIGYRFLVSKKESFIGKHVNTRFIDLVIEILQTHMQLAYFSEAVSLEGLKLTIRNSRHIIYATVLNNLITVMAFDNLKLAPELCMLQVPDRSQPCKFTLPVAPDNKLLQQQIAKNVTYNPNWVSPSPLASCSPVSYLSDQTTCQQFSVASSSFNPPTPQSSTSSIAAQSLSTRDTNATDENQSLPSSLNLNSQTSSSMGSLNETTKKLLNPHQATSGFASILNVPGMIKVDEVMGGENTMLRI